MHHEIRRCTKASCLAGRSCKFVHLTQDEVDDINNLVRPMTMRIYHEVKRIAFLLRETYPKEAQPHTCTKLLIGECIWDCISCKNNKFQKDQMPRCNFCMVPHITAIQGLVCEHTYCTLCINELPFYLFGPVPAYRCTVCKEFKLRRNLYDHDSDGNDDNDDYDDYSDDDYGDDYDEGAGDVGFTLFVI
ncbi:hypothetical protein PUN28_015764 [Cardiocondyla obscurior]|uniref:RING-type domain-containing protein n=1 Tax=Cardiocondyla obscurior TaxID=286306 RepID=A0AAW2EYE5_9HYME